MLRTVLCDIPSDNCYVPGLEDAENRRCRTNVSVNMAWDETTHVLSMPTNPLLTRQQQLAPWHVMVSTASMVTTTTSEALPATSSSLSDIRPPIALTNVGSSALYHGLFLVPAVRKFHVAVEGLCDKVECVTRNLAADGAAAGLKTVWFSCDKQHKRLLTSFKLCELHTLKIVENAVATCVSDAISSRLYSLTLMFKSATQYYLRLMFVVLPFLTQNLQFRRNPAPAGSKNFANEVLDFIMSRLEGVAKTDDAPHTKGAYSGTDRRRSFVFCGERKRFRQAWTRFVEILGYGWEHNQFIHYCDDPDNEAYKRSVVMDAAQCISKCIFNRIPSTPQSNKWTQRARCMIWFFLAMSPCALLLSLYKLAFGRLVVDLLKDRGTGTDEYADSMDYHRVNGKRMKQGEIFLEDKTMMIYVVILVVVQEVLQFYTWWLIVAGRSAIDVSAPLPIFDLVHDAFSPLVLARQYLSSILRGKSSRLKLIFLKCGCASIAELHVEQPATIAALRRAALTCDGWLYRKHYKPLRGYPWKLASIADKRLPRAFRRALAVEFLSDCDMCMDKYFSRRFRNTHLVDVTPDELVDSEFYQNILFYWAQSIQIHIAGIETRHARNRNALAGKQPSWNNLVSMYMCREAIQLMRTHNRILQHASEAAQTLALPSSSADGDLLLRLMSARRRLSPADFVRRDGAARLSASASWTDPDASITMMDRHTDARRQVVSAAPSDMQRIERIARASGHIARCNNKRRRATPSAVSSVAQISPPAAKRRHYDNGIVNALNDFLARPTADLDMSLPYEVAGPCAENSIDAGTPAMSIDVLKSLLKYCDSTHGSIRTGFKCTAGIIGSGRVNGVELIPTKGILGKVNYPTQCNALCDRHFGSDIRRLAVDLVNQLDAYRKLLCPPFKLPYHELLVAFEIGGEPGAPSSAVRFALIPICSGGFGGNLPTFTFYSLLPEMHVSPSETYAGLELTLSYNALVENQCGLKALFAKWQYGIMDSYDEYEWVKHLSTTDDLFGETTMRRIRCVRLAHIPVPNERIDTFKVVDGPSTVIALASMDKIRQPDEAPAGQPDNAPTDWLDSSDDELPAAAPAFEEPHAPEPVFVSIDREVALALGLDEQDVDNLVAQANVMSDLANDEGGVSWDDKDLLARDSGSDSASDEDGGCEDVRSFPAGPHDLSSIVLWSDGCSTVDIMDGLSYLGFRQEFWRFFYGDKYLGKLYCQNGKVMRAECWHPPRRVVTLKNGREISENRRCRCSLALHVGSTADLRAREAQLAAWLVCGSVVDSAEHQRLGAALEQLVNPIRQGCHRLSLLFCGRGIKN